MRVSIDTNEVYPVFSWTECQDDRPFSVEVPDETVERWKAAEDLWDKCQKEMAELGG